MIKMFTASTLEVDDKEFALSEILEQLKPEQNQREYTAGIMICHSDFIETGVAQEISAKLPFDVVGCTSLANIASGMDDSLMLSISMFTSDEIQFSTFCTADLSQRDSIAKSYAATKKDGNPALVIPFIPLLISVAHEQILLDLDAAVTGAPVFGTVASDHTANYSTCYTFFNGDISQTAMSALLFWGKLDPVFCYSEMSEKYIQRQRAVITKSQGNMLMEVNNVPLLEYLETIGVTKGKGAEALGGVPLLIDFGDGTHPAARGVHTITEEGYALCGGLMPENATIAVGSVEHDDVLRLTELTLKTSLETGKTQGLIMFPCASHYLVLGVHSQEQKAIIKKMAPDTLPYHLCYSGGEICPVYDNEGKIHNRFHSYTFTACIF